MINPFSNYLSKEIETIYHEIIVDVFQGIDLKESSHHRLILAPKQIYIVNYCMVCIQYIYIYCTRNLDKFI